ncbi:unnamed protein product [Paramecium octaurelia]|uniref:G domain-containing protein n=1 Tax=Paramecium octaurelia TaxID=43137 RepID=A0A8S1YJE7_PAROT|nr:unnamed protein product [Paramecium octaurelia]
METKKPIALLLSKVGRGKTSFFNKICTEFKKTQFGGSSCTREIFLKCTSYGEGFYLMDTPGFGCDEDIITHLSALFVASERPLNAILILTKFDRSCVMREEINQALSMLSSCREIIIIIVTFWDDVEKEPEESQEKLRSDIEEQVMKPLKLKSFICTSKGTPGDLICKQLDELIQNNVKRSVQLTPQEFSFQFSKHTLFSIQDEMETHKLKQAFQIKCDIVLKFIQQQPDKLEKTSELMHEIILLIKKEGHKTVMEFTNQNRDKFEKLVDKFGVCEYTYLAYTKLQAEIMGYLQQVKEKAILKMQTYKYHCFNFIRKCEHCGQIWYKVSGCKYLTKCGKKLPVKDEPNHTPKPKQFQILFNENNLDVIENNQINEQSILNQQSSNNSQKQSSQEDQSKGLLGCGREFNWKTAPRLSEQEIIELRDTGYLDMLCMVQDKDSKDIENEKRYWQKVEEQQQKERKSLNRQIEAENRNFEQKHLKKENDSQEIQFIQERKYSDQQIAISQSKQANNQTSIKDDAQLQNESCSVSTCNIS